MFTEQVSRIKKTNASVALIMWHNRRTAMPQGWAAAEPWNHSPPSVKMLFSSLKNIPASNQHLTLWIPSENTHHTRVNLYSVYHSCSHKGGQLICTKLLQKELWCGWNAHQICLLSPQTKKLSTNWEQAQEMLFLAPWQVLQAFTGPKSSAGAAKPQSFQGMEYFVHIDVHSKCGEKK